MFGSRSLNINYGIWRSVVTFKATSALNPRSGNRSLSERSYVRSTICNCCWSCTNPFLNFIIIIDVESKRKLSSNATSISFWSTRIVISYIQEKIIFALITLHYSLISELIGSTIFVPCKSMFSWSKIFYIYTNIRIICQKWNIIHTATITKITHIFNSFDLCLSTVFGMIIQPINTME